MTTRTQSSTFAFRDVFIVGALVVLALLLLPLLATIGLALQFVFVIAGPVALLAALVYAWMTPAER